MKRIFLLGGHDLEMLTIRNLLIDRGVSFQDAKTQWNNALLSRYSNYLNDQDEFYGIELKEDCPLPAHYHRIDHHNDLPPTPSALEQVATLLGVQLNRWQILVAANDSGYIPAMQLLGATDIEIDDVRRADRQAQGVTSLDEELAVLSIQNQLNQYGSLTVVKALSAKFSPICDRLFPYDNLLIYNGKELTFFGKEKAVIVHHLQQFVENASLYQGGGDKGYCGIANGFYSERKITIFANQIINLFL